MGNKKNNLWEKRISKEIILGKMQIGENFGFFIPDDRDNYGWDFYVNKKHFWGAKNGELVKAVEIQSSWKKPEAKIISVKWSDNELNETFAEWVFSFSPDGNWGFVDTIWKEWTEWYFIHSKNVGWAQYWDYVKAKIEKKSWKLEGAIVKILKDKFEKIEWTYTDTGEFGFVKVKSGQDIFIPWKWKFWAKEKEKVTAKIISKSWRRPEWIIVNIENKSI
jgi:exoribonuclease R